MNHNRPSKFRDRTRVVANAKERSLLETDFGSRLDSGRRPRSSFCSKGCRRYENFEHPEIVKVFAERFDQLPQFIVGRPDYREHNYTGILAPIIVARAQLRTDGVIELLEAIIEVDWSKFS